MHLRSLAAILALSMLGACAAAPSPELEIETAAPPVSRETAPFAEAVAQGRFAAAVAGLRPVVRAHPDLTEAKLLLAEAYLGQGDVGPAEELFTAARQQATTPSQHLAALTGLGVAALHAGDPEAAETSFRVALEVDERSAEAWNGLALSLDRQGHAAQARVAARRAVQRAPRWQAAHNNLGVILMNEGGFAEAERAFAEAFALDKSSPVVATNLRLAIAMQGRYEEALAGIAPAAEPDAFNNVGYAALMRGDLPTADRYLRRAVELSPTYHDEAHDNLRLLGSLQRRRTVAAGSAEAQSRSGDG